MPSRYLKIQHKLKQAALCFALWSCATSAPQTSAETQTKHERQFGVESAEKIANDALHFLNHDQHQAAIDRLEGVLDLPNLTPYEKSIIFQMKGQAHYALKQTEKAIQAFEDAIAAKGLLPNETNQLRVNIAQLWVGAGEYERGAEM